MISWPEIKGQPTHKVNSLQSLYLFPCLRGYDYVDAYLQSSWEDVDLEVTVFCKITDVTSG